MLTNSASAVLYPTLGLKLYMFSLSHSSLHTVLFLRAFCCYCKIYLFVRHVIQTHKNAPWRRMINWELKEYDTNFIKYVALVTLLSFIWLFFSSLNFIFSFCKSSEECLSFLSCLLKIVWEKAAVVSRTRVSRSVMMK